MPINQRWFLPDYFRYAREACGEGPDDFDVYLVAEELWLRCEGVSPDAVFDAKGFAEILMRYNISKH